MVHGKPKNLSFAIKTDPDPRIFLNVDDNTLLSTKIVVHAPESFDDLNSNRENFVENSRLGFPGIEILLV